MDDEFNVLEDAVRYMYAQIVWTHKVQEKQADIFAKNQGAIETANIVFSSLTACGITTVLINKQIYFTITSLLLSAATIFLALALKTYRFNENAKSHKETANRLLAIRNETTVLLTSIRLKNKSAIELENKYASLIYKANSIYKEAPSTTDKAVQLARIALHTKGDNSFSEDEINSYLPEALHKGDAK